MIKIEIWKDIKDFPNYQISNKGNLRKILKSGKLRYMKMNSLDKDGYIKVSMSKNGKKFHLRAHRIVALVFIENPENKAVVNHINGIKNDNRIENLEWVTISENTKHGFEKLGRVGHCGNQNKKVKVVFENGEILKFNSQTECSKYFGLSERAISNYIKYPFIKKKKIKINDFTIVRDC